MENFILYNPVKVHFGHGVVEGLGHAVSKYGKRVLLVYGQGSIKRNGIYDQVMAQLIRIGAEVFEYSGIQPNPIVEDVDKAAELAREKHVEVILAVGGGSVIDSAKIIGITVPVDHSAWDFMKDKTSPRQAVPLIAVLTLAATGSEMNRFAVIQNNETKEKIGTGWLFTYPKESFLDPAYTLTVSKDYTGYGIADLTAHCLEAYFGEGEATLSDRIVYAIIREAMVYGPELMNNLEDYSLRAKIMYAATNALNNLTSYGRKNGDWGVHDIAHVLSVLYDVPHGASLSIVYPAWLRLHRQRAGERIAELGRNLFNTSSLDETIKRLETFLSSIDCPIRLSQINLKAEEKGAEILETMIINEVEGNHHKLDETDYRELIRLMT